MLLTVRNLWPSGALFVFNCYHNWSSLVLRNGNGTASFLHSREGVTQGDPLEMISYGIGILPLINNLKREIPDATKPWYYENAGALGTFARIATYFNSLTHQGSGHGYYPTPPKSALIMHPENFDTRKEFVAHYRFKVYTGARYLGGYIGYGNPKRDWMRERKLTWEKNISTVRETAGKHLQESYAAVVHAIQQEWIFLQHVTWDKGYVFAGVDKMIRETFLPHIFFRKKKTLPHITPFWSQISPGA